MSGNEVTLALYIIGAVAVASSFDHPEGKTAAAIVVVLSAVWPATLLGIVIGHRLAQATSWDEPGKSKRRK